MRPPRVTGEAVVADQLNQLLRRFQYPDENTRSPAFVPGGGGGAPTYVIAKADSTSLSKGKADYVMGLNEDLGTVINAWMTGGTGGGSGDFNSDTVPGIWICEALTAYHVSVAAGGIQANGARIRGVGQPAIEATDSDAGTIVRASQVHSVLVSGAPFTTGQVGIHAGEIVGCRVHGCETSLTGGGPIMAYGNRIDSRIVCGLSAVVIANNTWAGSQAGTYIHASPIGNPDIFGLVIVGNNMRGTDEITHAPRVVIESGVEATVVGNFISGRGGTIPAVLLDACERTLVGANTFFAATQNHTLVLDGGPDNTISGNVFRRSEMQTDDTYDVVHLTGAAERTVVQGNTIAGEGGILSNNRSGLFIDTGVLDTIAVSNVFSDTFGTQAIIDNGTGTLLDYPSDPTVGDNFVV